MNYGDIWNRTKTSGRLPLREQWILNYVNFLGCILLASDWFKDNQLLSQLTHAHYRDTVPLMLLSWTSQKISTKKNLARVEADEQNGPLAFGSLPEKAVRTRRKLRNVVLATSVYKQPTKLWTTTVSSSLRGKHKKGRGGGWEKEKRKREGSACYNSQCFLILPTNSLTNLVTSTVNTSPSQLSRGRFSAWPKLSFFVYRKLS